jgi:hypothetical protein
MYIYVIFLDELHSCPKSSFVKGIGYGYYCYQHIIYYIVSTSTIELAYAEQEQQDVITIIPGASDKNNPAFFDVTYYPIQVAKELRWYNADDADHKIIISRDNETKGAEDRCPAIYSMKNEVKVNASIK